jgi:hypothetical protein
MKKISISLAILLGLLIAISGLNSCDDEPVDDGCQLAEFDGTFIGKYWLLNLIELTNNDTAIITTSGSTVTITSALLGTSFTAEFDETTHKATVSNESFPQFIIGGDTLFDISVQSGTVQLDNNCNHLFISLSGVSVGSGTVELPESFHTPQKPDGYPLENASMNTKNGLKRQP